MKTQLSVTETTQTSPIEQHLTLRNGSWETYEELLDAFGEHRAVRLHYDKGVLDFMVMSYLLQLKGWQTAIPHCEMNIARGLVNTGSTGGQDTVST